MSRALTGGLAGICATMAMTAVARRMHRALPSHEQYPLPPTELVEQAVTVRKPNLIAQEAIGIHFAFGAFAGAVYRGLPLVRRFPAPAYGAVVWAVSYLGWIPALGLLKPATEHPWRRNMLMVSTHLVWGAVLSATLRELDEAARGSLADREPRSSTPDDRKNS